MLSGIFETHLDVADLDRATDFYTRTLGLLPGYHDDVRRASFLWVGQPGQGMLGLWEKSPDAIRPQHFAFQAPADWILNESTGWLRARGLAGFNFLRDGTDQPMVFGWMPALSIYFHDPDGHVLELIAMLPDTPRPELGVVTWNDWLKSQIKSVIA
jgi:catechol 2,3-dioxygenase-like lactoylglutathione lyase family enzyme